MRGVDVGDDALAAIAAACPGLTSLALGSNNPFGGGRGGGFSSLGLEGVLTHCRDLVSLVAAGTGPGLVDADLAALLASWPLPRLTALDLSGNTGLGDATATALLDACPAVQTLKLFRCMGLGDAGLLSLLYLPSLVTLDVGNCTAITGPGLGRAMARVPDTFARLRCGGLRATRDREALAALRAALPPAVLLEM
jgi:hypothetical protein